jgi:hypothetical protein
MICHSFLSLEGSPPCSPPEIPVDTHRGKKPIFSTAHRGSMPRYLVPVILAAALVLSAGCAQQAPASVVPSGGLSAAVSKVEDHWNPGLGCYWKPSGTVYNSGDAVARDVVVYVQLVDTSSGNIRDAETIALGSLAKGDSRSFEVSLDGECDHTYRVEVRPVAGS